MRDPASCEFELNVLNLDEVAGTSDFNDLFHIVKIPFLF